MRAMPEETSATPSPEATKLSCAMAEPTSRTPRGSNPASRQAATTASSPRRVSSPKAGMWISPIHQSTNRPAASSENR